MHLIKQHIIEVNCSKQCLGHEFRNDLNSVLDSDFYPKLEKLLDAYNPSELLWFIDQLPIVISDLNAKQWKTDFIDQSLHQIEVFLKEHTLEYENVNQESIKIKGCLKMDKKKYAQGLMVKFLETGLLESNALTKTLTDLFEIIEIDSDFIKMIKKAFKGKSQSILRWSLNVPQHLKFEFLGTDGIAHDLDFAVHAVDRSPQLNDFLEYLYWVGFFNEASTILDQSFMAEIKSIAKIYYNIEEPYVDTLLYQHHNNNNNNNEEIIQGQSNGTSNIEQDAKESSRTLNIEQDAKELILKPNPKAKDIPLYIENAGLVLLHPYLPKLFTDLEYLEEGLWKDTTLQHRACFLLQYLVASNDIIFENDLPFNKILCGIPLIDTVHTKIKLTAKEKEVGLDLLQAVINHWTILKKTSIAGLQESFIQRSGKIIQNKDERFELTVEEKSYDLLLDQLPWGIGMIKTPWMDDYLTCHWR